MTDTTHPSDEQLTAFFDKQLPDHKHTPIQDHLAGCSECGAVLSDFAVLQDMGPLVEESLPGDLYWEDLPDRVLARIASGSHAGLEAGGVDPALAPEPAANPVPASERSWWRALWSPAVRWSAATAMVAVAGIAVINTLGGDSAVSGTDLASTEPGSTAGSVPVPDAAPAGAVTASMEPAEYAERVAHTLSHDGNLGTQLDGTAGRASGGYVGYSPIQTVSLGLMDNREMQQPVDFEPAAPVERQRQPNPSWYFFTALRAEQRGSCDLAQAGYLLAHTQTQPQDPIHIAAEAGLTRCAWRAAMVQAGSRSADTLAQLRDRADALFDEHAAGRHQDCVKAWELLVSYLDLAKGTMTQEQMQEGRARLRSLAKCVE